MADGFIVRVEFDKAKLAARLEGLSERSIAAVANEALKDANYYVRKDSGELERSSLRASQPEKGKLVWDTSYAKRVYYTGSPSPDVNPNASLLWAHRGFAENKAKYQRIAEAAAGVKKMGV